MHSDIVLEITRGYDFEFSISWIDNEHNPVNVNDYLIDIVINDLDNTRIYEFPITDKTNSELLVVISRKIIEKKLINNQYVYFIDALNKLTNIKKRLLSGKVIISD